MAKSSLHRLHRRACTGLCTFAAVGVACTKQVFWAPLYEWRLLWLLLIKITVSSNKQWRKQLLRIFGPELIWINSLIKAARSVVSNNRTQRDFFFAASAAKFWNRDISSAPERAFPGVFGDIFGCSTPSKKRCFSVQEFTRFLSTVSSQRRAATRSDVSFQTK